MIWLVLGLILVGSLAAMYIVNPTIQEIKVGNETIKIGVRDAINTLINAMKPLPKVNHNYSCFPYYEKIILLNGTKIYGIPEEFYKLIGDTIEVCYKENSKACCLNITLKDMILINVKPAQKTIYITNKELINKLIEILNKKQYNEILTLIIKGIINGEIQGVTIEDIRKLTNL